MTQPTPLVLLSLLLAAAPAASAQTLVETSTAVSVQNTLTQTGTPAAVPRVPALPIPPAPPTAPSSPAPAASTPAPVPITPLTPAQVAALGQAQAALRGGQLGQARTLFERLIAQNYAQPEPHFGLGLTLFAQNDLRGAAFEFTQLVALAPGRYEGPYNLGVIATREGRHADALKFYGEAANLARGKAGTATVRQVLGALAAEQTRAGDFAGLSTTLGEVAALDPNDVDAQFRLAQARTLAGQGALALPGAYAVLQRQPAHVNAALLVADIYVAQGLSNRAVRELDAAAGRVSRAEDRGRLLLRKADVLAASGDARGAVLAAQEATRADMRSAAAFARLAELRVVRGDRSGALAAYQSAVRLAPRDAGYRVGLAALRLALGQNADAARDAAQALRLSPEPATLARAQFVRGLAAYRQGQHGPARAALRSSALVSPSADTFLWLGLSAYAQQDYAGAATALSESVRLDPTPAARQNLASALLASARYPEAEAVLRGLVGEQPKNNEAWYLLGLAQRAQTREAEARQSLKTAANLGNAKAQGALK
ncbi:tetratricopeptide repeat protein [Deinococcus planocerae]|uniref:tetratricopeptide repeat protein n=1 Tax=Deinococcus planocerae TaxID=1737569 RepID=UPI001FE2C554|nr:tetratricopeptide repeat protein [Deinococcus planocerae]